MESATEKRWVLVFALLIAAIAVRISLFNFVTGDVFFWVMPWYDYILKNGLSALGHNIPNADGYRDMQGNYTPVYYYLLFIATYFDGIFHKLYLVKSVSILFDFLAAFFMYKLARLSAPSPKDGWIGFFIVLFAPTVLANGALWGQCDVIPAAFSV